MASDLQTAFIGAVEKAMGSIVGIGGTVAPWGPPYRPSARRGVGSGVVFDTAGHILTTRHVVADAEKILIAPSVGRILGGTLVGTDEETDLAVLQVETNDLRPAEFGDSNALKVGQPVLAIGNPLGLSGGPSVTSGIISSLHRNLRRDWLPYSGLNVIQTDAAVNPGNSGGPLVDLEGRVVAITTATMPWAEGIGFAIPINTAKHVAEHLIAYGRVPRPWLGIAGYDVDRRVAWRFGLPEMHGVLVTEVKPSSPAAESGIQVGDVLTGIGGKPVGDLGDLLDTLGATKIGDAVDLDLNRQGTKARLKVRLGTRPF